MPMPPCPNVPIALISSLATSQFRNGIANRGYFISESGGAYYMYVIEGDDGPEWALYDLTVDDVTGLTRHFIDGVSARILQQGARVEDVENVIVYGGVQYYLADTTAYGGTVAKAIAV